MNGTIVIKNFVKFIFIVPSLSKNVSGYLYTLYTTVAYANNEIFKADRMGDGSIYGRTTNE